MKKPIIIIVVLAVLAAAGYLLWQRLGGPAGLPLVAALDAETTVGAAGVQDAMGVWKSTREMIEKLPAASLGDVDLKVLRPEVIAAKLGFDPATPEGWASVGIDPAPGIAFAADARLLKDVKSGAGLPVVLLRVTDQPKALAAAERISGLKASVSDANGKSSILTVGTERILLGEKAGITILAPLTSDLQGPALAAARTAFEGFLESGGARLGADPTWRSAFGDAKGGLQSWFFVGARGALALVKSLGLGADVETVANFYAKLFPGIAVYASPEGGGGMLVAAPEAVRALEQIARPHKAPPRFTALLPAKGALVARFSVNLPEVTTGIAALLPPNVPAEVRMGLEMGKALLPMQAGVSWEDLTQAVSGHVAVAVDTARLSATSGPDKAWVALVGAQVPEKLDALLVKLAHAAKEKLGMEIGAVDIAGAKGFHLGEAAGGFTAVRKDDLLVVGPHEQVDAVVRGTAVGLKDNAAAFLDDDVVYGLYVDPAAVSKLVEMAAKDGGDPGAKALQAALGGFGEQGGAGFDARLTGNGLRFRSLGAGGMGATLIGTLAAVAIPAFTQYERKAKSTEAPMNVRRLYDGAAMYYNESHVDQLGNVLPKQFPGRGRSMVVAPEDWHDKVCVGGTSVKYQPDASTFADPVFKSLGFSLDEPFFYQYQFVTDGEGTGATFTARAIGDLDCDGVYSTFERAGSIDSSGNVSGGGMFQKDEAE